MAESARGTKKPKPLGKRLLNTLRKQLETEREELTESVRRLEADFRDESWKEPRSDDDAETGSATFERERTMSLAQNARAMILQIDRALARMEAGSYGQCASCGDAINPERIEAVPHTIHCLDCQRKAERSLR
jgi:DnaK suppressor protein